MHVPYLALKSRRRRPTTKSSEAKGIKKSEIEQGVIIRADSYKKKPLTVNYQHEELLSNEDQAIASSVNRFRARSKANSESAIVTRNNSTFINLNKDKKKSDGYKVIFYFNK